MIFWYPIVLICFQEEDVSGSPVELVFQTVEQHIKSDPSLAKKINAIITWNIKRGDKIDSWSKNYMYIFIVIDKDDERMIGTFKNFL